MKLKVSQCGGAGPFVVIVVADPSPQYTDEETAHGTDRVNKNMFNAKRVYRRWSGEGGFRVHGTYSAIEAEHDVRVLLGVRPYALAAERLLVGSDSSAEELSDSPEEEKVVADAQQSKRRQRANNNGNHYYSSGMRGGVRGLAGRFLAEMAEGVNADDGSGSSFRTRRGTIAFPSSASYFNAFHQQSPASVVAAGDSENDEAASLPPQAKGNKHSKKKKKEGDKKAKGGEGPSSIKEAKGGALAVADGLLLYSARRPSAKEKEQRQGEAGNAADASALGLSVELMRWPSCNALWFALSAAASTVTQATDASITPLLRVPPFASDTSSSSRPPAPAMTLAFATNAGSAISSSSSSSFPSHVVFDWRAEDRRRLLRNGAGMAGEGGGLSPSSSSFYMSASVVHGDEEGNSAGKKSAGVATMAAADCAAYTSYYYLPRHRQGQHSARSSSSKSVAGVSVLRPIFVTATATTGINSEKKNGGGGFSSAAVDFFDGGALRECLDEERSVLAGGGDALLVGDTPKSRGSKGSDAEGVRLRAAAFSMPSTMKPNAPAQAAKGVRGVAWLASLEIRAPSSSEHQQQHQPSASATVKDMLAAVHTVVSATYGTVLMPHVRAAVLRGASEPSEETDPSLSAVVLTYALHLEALASGVAASSPKTLTAVRKLLLQASAKRGEEGGVSYLPERMRLLSRVASSRCNEARVDALLAPRFSPSALLATAAEGGGLFPAETAEELKSAFPRFFSDAAASSDSLSATALIAGDRSALQSRLEEELKRVVTAEGVNTPPKKKGFDNKRGSYQQGEALPSFEGGDSVPSPLLPPFLDRPDLFLLDEGGSDGGAEPNESSNGILCAAGRGVAVMTVVAIEGIGRVFMDVCVRL